MSAEYRTGISWQLRWGVLWCQRLVSHFNSPSYPVFSLYLFSSFNSSSLRNELSFPYEHFKQTVYHQVYIAVTHFLPGITDIDCFFVCLFLKINFGAIQSQTLSEVANSATCRNKHYSNHYLTFEFVSIRATNWTKQHVRVLAWGEKGKKTKSEQEDFSASGNKTDVKHSQNTGGKKREELHNTKYFGVFIYLFCFLFD